MIPGEWQRQAACQAHAALFGTVMGGPVDLTARANIAHQTAEQDALDVCDACPVKQQCAEWALSMRPEDVAGVVGGLTAEQRRLIADRVRRARDVTWWDEAYHLIQLGESWEHVAMRMGRTVEALVKRANARGIPVPPDVQAAYYRENNARRVARAAR